jgi:hypothetical protein
MVRLRIQKEVPRACWFEPSLDARPSNIQPRPNLDGRGPPFIKGLGVQKTAPVRNRPLSDALGATQNRAIASHEIGLSW